MSPHRKPIYCDAVSPKSPGSCRDYTTILYHLNCQCGYNAEALIINHLQSKPPTARVQLDPAHQVALCMFDQEHTFWTENDCAPNVFGGVQIYIIYLR